MLLYAPKISAGRPEFQSYRQHRKYAFSSDTKVLSSETVASPRRNDRPTTRRKTNQGGEIAVEPPGPVSSSSEDGGILEGAVAETGRESNSASQFMDDSGGEEIDGGEVSENEVIRNLRKPVPDTKQVFGRAKASVDRRHYFVIDSMLGRNVIARWYGGKRRKFHKEYKRAKERVRELAPINSRSVIGLF